MRKIFTFLCAALMSVGMWALTPKSGDTWDETTKTLTVNSNPEVYAYWGESDIEHVVISDAVTSIGDGAFEECSALTSVTIGNNVESIGNSAFAGCSDLTSVTIGNSVTSIGDNAFQSCSGLTSITIPNSVTSIGGYAFYDCSNLETVTIYAESLESYGTDAFEGTAATLTIYVPAGSVDTYKTAWTAYDDKIVAIPAPTPTYLDADFAIDFRTDPYTVVGGGALPDGVTVDGSMNTGDANHGYSSPVITIPVTAGNYLVKMGTCQFSNADGSVKNEDGSETYATLATNNGTCYHNSTAANVVGAIFNVPSDQIIKVHGAQYTPYFSIQKMPEIPAFTDFELNFRTDPYSVSGTMPTGTNIAGTYHDNLHGYQNVIATVPVKAGKYRLTLGACEYDSNAGTVMSETNVELASFDQNLGAGKCYHNNTTKNIVSVIFDVDKDQHVAIQCGNYTPYMKLEAVTAYQVSFALGDAEGTAPAAVDVTIGNEIAMPVNKTMYKEGYTLTGWSDGVNTYPIGESFTPDNDVVLTPVFTANEADLLNASTDVTVKWYFGGDNGAPSMILQGATGLLVAQATIGDKTVDVKLAIDATSGKFAPQPTTEWAQVNVGTIFTYPYKEGITVDVHTYSGNVTYYIADAEGKVSCGVNDYYSFIQVTYPKAVDPTAIENVQTNHVQAIKFLRDGMLYIVRDNKLYNMTGTQVK